MDYVFAGLIIVVPLLIVAVILLWLKVIGLNKKAVLSIYKTSNANWIIYIWFTLGIAVLIFSVFEFDNGITLRETSNPTDSVLSILITFLVAWQIWQTMASRDDIKEAKEAAEKANKVAEDVKLLNAEFKASLDLFAAYQSSSNGLSFLLNNRPYKAFHLFATAIIDSLKFTNDQCKCAMSAFVNFEQCMDFDNDEESLNEYKENWDSVVGRLNEVEKALHAADQENIIFQALAKKRIDGFKEAARRKGFKI